MHIGTESPDQNNKKMRSFVFGHLHRRFAVLIVVLSKNNHFFLSVSFEYFMIDCE